MAFQLNVNARLLWSAINMLLSALTAFEQKKLRTSMIIYGVNSPQISLTWDESEGVEISI